MENGPLLTLIILSGIMAFSAVISAGRHIYKHLTNYSRPDFQLHIVRILAMVPIYSMTSWLQLVSRKESTKLVLELARDSYEAYVIYNFVVLLINYGGGDRRLSRYLESQPRIPHPWPLNIWLPPMKPGPSFMNFIRASVLQFVFVKPSGSLLKLYVFHRSSMQAQSVVRICMYPVNNVSISLALYGLVVFYHAAHELLLPYHPLPKFLSVKAVVFFSFWQGVVISIAVRLGLIHDIEGFSAGQQAAGLQDLLICLEMAIAAVMHYYVFSYQEYRVSDEDGEMSALMPGKRKVLASFRDVVDFRDVLLDVKDTMSGGLGTESELQEGAPVASLERELLSEDDCSYQRELYATPRYITRGGGSISADLRPVIQLVDPRAHIPETQALVQKERGQSSR